MSKIDSIEGTITLTDGGVSKFLITANGWQQWGAVLTERLGETSEALEVMTSALADFLGDEDGVIICEFCGHADLSTGDQYCPECDSVLS